MNTRDLTAARERIARLSLLAVPFAAALAASPRVTMEQYELAKLLGVAAAAAFLFAAGGAARGFLSVPPLAALLAAVVLSTALSPAPVTSLLGDHQNVTGAVTWLLYAAVFAAAAAAPARMRGRIVGAAIAAAAVNAAYALSASAGFDPFRGELFRHVRAFAGNPDFLAQQMAMALPLALAVAVRGAGSLSAAAAAAAFLLVLLLTGSRAGALAGLAALAIFAWRARKSLLARRRVLLAAAGFFAAAVVASGAMIPARISLVGRLHALLAEEGIARSRGMMWEGTARAARERPVAGWGPDILKMVFLRHAPRGWASLEGLGTSARNAHNEPLNFLASFGAVGLGAYLWLLAFAARRHASRRRPWGDAIAASVAAYLIHNLFSFGAASTAPVFWLLLGLLCAPGETGGCGSRLPEYGGRGAGIAVLVFSCMAILGAARLAADGYAYRGNEAGRRSDHAEEARRFGQAAAIAFWEPAYLTRAARAIELAGGAEDPLPLYARAFALRPLDGIQLGHVGRVRFARAAESNDSLGRREALAVMLAAVELSPSQPSLYGAAIMAAQQLEDFPLRDRLIRRLRERDPEWAARMLGGM